MFSLRSLPHVTPPMAKGGDCGHPDTLQQIHSPAAVCLTTLASRAHGFVLPPELLAAVQHCPIGAYTDNMSCTDASGTNEKEKERVLYLSSENRRSNLH